MDCECSQNNQHYAEQPQGINTSGVCPCCGYCPHCGRRGFQTIPYTPTYPVYPAWPFNPTYPYTGPIWIYTPTVTC